MVTCHCGSLADGEKAMRPLKEFQSPVVSALGRCLLSAQRMLDAAYPKGALNY